VGHFTADLLVNDNIIVELKSVTQLVKAHEVQVVNYLTATKKNVGLLINFGEKGVQIKRKVKNLNFEEVAMEKDSLQNPVNPVNPVIIC
jgi:hypothetical protein